MADSHGKTAKPGEKICFFHSGEERLALWHGYGLLLHLNEDLLSTVFADNYRKLLIHFGKGFDAVGGERPVLRSGDSAGRDDRSFPPLFWGTILVLFRLSLMRMTSGVFVMVMSLKKFFREGRESHFIGGFCCRRRCVDRHRRAEPCVKVEAI